MERTTKRKSGGREDARRKSNAMEVSSSHAWHCACRLCSCETHMKFHHALQMLPISIIYGRWPMTDHHHLGLLLAAVLTGSHGRGGELCHVEVCFERFFWMAIESCLPVTSS